MTRTIAVLGAIAGCLATSACRKHPKLAVLPAPRPLAAPVHTVAELITEPPEPEFPAAIEVERPFVLPEQGPLPQPPPAARRRILIAPAPKQGPEPPPPATARLPGLEAMLSEDEQKHTNAEIDANLRRAGQDLASCSNRQLTKAQRAVFNQIQVFIKQARALRPTDSAGARGLARKASIMARDLKAAAR